MTEQCGGRAHYWIAEIVRDARPRPEQPCLCGAWTWEAWISAGGGWTDITSMSDRSRVYLGLASPR